MKKLSLILILLSGFAFASASIDQNLKYGQKDNNVSELQEYLISKGFLNSTPTGFFGLLTLKAVKDYQISAKLPSTGFVGPMTRTAINADIDIEVADSVVAEVQETGTNTPIVISDSCINIEGVQSYVPVGMWNRGDGVCYVPPVATSTPTVYTPPVVVKSDPSTITYASPDRSSLNIKVVYVPYSGQNFAVGEDVSFQIRGTDYNGNKIQGVEMIMTMPDGTNKKSYPQQEDLYTFVFKPTTTGVQKVNFDIPSRNIKKDYLLTIDTFIPIAPTATFQKGFESEFNVNTRNRVGMGYINVDQKNQKIRLKNIEYEVISDTFTKEEIDLKIGEYWTNKGVSDSLHGLNTFGLPIEFFPINHKSIKSGKFKIKITKLTVISNFNGNLNDNNIIIDTTGWESQEVTVTP